MADDGLLQIILGAFASPDRAAELYARLRESEELGMIDIVDLALVRRDRSGTPGQFELPESTRRAPEPQGSLSAILHIISGPLPSESSESRLQGFADALPPGSSAIAALIEHRWLTDVRALMEEAGAETVSAALKSEIAEALADGRDVVLTAGAADWSALERFRLPAPRRPDPG